MENSERTLIVGLDVVSLAHSARNAGYKVLAVDYFGDVDLQRLCVKTESIIKQRRGETCGQISKDFSPHMLTRLIDKIWKNWKIDFVLVSSGFEDSPGALRQLYKFPVIGNDPESIMKVRDKVEFYEKLKALGIGHPDTFVVENVKEAESVCKALEYPVLLKPEATLGGTGIRKVSDKNDLRDYFKDLSSLHGRVVVQEYVKGTPISVSLLSSGREAIALTINEQLIGLSSIGAKEPFSYCGNIVPATLPTETLEACVEFSTRIAKYFKLLGSNGVDLVVSPEGAPYVIEVNPRFQGSLECVEYVSGVNMVKAHIAACLEKRLPEQLHKKEAYCIRLILYAPKRLIAPDISGVDGVRDIPFEGVIIEKGEPFCSIMAYGKTRGITFRKAEVKARLIYKAINLQGVDGEDGGYIE